MKSTLLLLICLLPMLFAQAQKTDFPVSDQTELLAQVEQPEAPATEVVTEEVPASQGEDEAVETVPTVEELFFIEDPLTPAEKLWAFLKQNWAGLLLGLIAFIEIIVRLTPTEKDNSWFGWIKQILDALIPNRSKFGGTHPS